MSVYIPPRLYPIYRRGVAGVSELTYMATIRSPVRFDAGTFCVAKCLTVWESEKLWIFKKNGTPFCTVNFPSGGSPEADGYYLGTVVFSGASITFADGDILTLTAPDSAEGTGGTCSFSLLGTPVV